MERCVKEARELKLRDGVLEKFLHGNAQRVFFDRIKRDSHGESLRTGMEGY